MIKKAFPLIVIDCGVTGFFVCLIAFTLQWPLLNLPTLPTGGDLASHVLTAWYFTTEFLPSGKLTAWMPEVFGGLPALSYYFPLPFITIAALEKILGFAIGFKWATVLPSLLLPGTVFVVVRRFLQLHWLSALTAALASLAYLLHEQNSIWGGNLLSTLSGEFAYSYGQLFAVLALVAWLRAKDGDGMWIVAGVLEAFTGASHGYPLLVVGISSFTLLFIRQNCRQTMWIIIKGNALAFCLLAGWLWPLLEMHGYTVANDNAYFVEDWHDLLPNSLLPFTVMGLIGSSAWLFPSILKKLSPGAVTAASFFAAAAVVSVTGWLAAESLGMADIRFFPLAWLCGGITAGIVFGEAFAAIAVRGGMLTIACSAVVLLVGTTTWIAHSVHRAPDWAFWNYSGYEAKPQWQNLTRLFPLLKGTPTSSRLVFEHAPANSDLGSTRALEALPMFLGGRPVLEGLYMESALLGPAIYWLQSEISAQPSSPLSRFPSGSLDLEKAAVHMQWLHADTLLLRSDAAKLAAQTSKLFEKIGEAPPFAVYQLRNFSSQMITPVTWDLLQTPMAGWMENAFDWFRRQDHRDGSQPYYLGKNQHEIHISHADPARIKVSDEHISREEIRFSTTGIGTPHLIKMAFHPRWQLASPGTLTLAAPGFMLVVPETTQVVLHYSTTLIGKVGKVVSTFACFFLAFICIKRILIFYNYKQKIRLHRDVLTDITEPSKYIAWIAILFITSMVIHALSPERNYRLGWQSMRHHDYAKAQFYFIESAGQRRGRGRSEEAIFWAAKASELGGRKKEALALYTKLILTYSGYWVPEALYTAAELARTEGNLDQANAWTQRLNQNYPANIWSKKSVKR
ncbi:6-pyruvoyl-tetrahydropterin synthase-related protein [Polaromonas glacialis]|uniref:6-pyruvoyl-tetrahydropterin synthase-related protein n=1 Tax=Polaromonas glacialis TaxID=866564 RepID=UPI0009FF0A3D|nr:6-pyruvoyl-tetrahydropterin synthase-related protein [Polaromonas glacialis]